MPLPTDVWLAHATAAARDVATTASVQSRCRKGSRVMMAAALLLSMITTGVSWYDMRSPS
jgi:hypothetical protein